MCLEASVKDRVAYCKTVITSPERTQLNWRRALWSLRWPVELSSVGYADVITLKLNSTELKSSQLDKKLQVCCPSWSSERAQNFTTDSKLATFLWSWVDFFAWSHRPTGLNSTQLNWPVQNFSDHGANSLWSLNWPV